jgi:hypothetical protein
MWEEKKGSLLSLVGKDFPKISFARGRFCGFCFFHGTLADILKVC